MLSLLARSRRAAAPVAPRLIRLHLEPLEDRLSPSGMEMLYMSVAYNPNKEVTLSGSLMTQTGPVANQAINFGGAVSGTTTTNSQGQYSVTLKATQLGQVTGVSADGLSNTAQLMLVGGAPVINNFTAICQGGGLWTFTGKVSGAPMQGEVIHFDGLNALVGKTCDVNPDGTFTLSTYISNGQGGVAIADAVDWWGDTSSDATTTVVC